MSKVAALCWVVLAFFVGAFADRQFGPAATASQWTSAEHSLLKQERDKAWSDLHRAEESIAKANAIITELGGPLKVRGLREQIGEAAQCTDFKLDLDKYPQLAYRVVATPPEEGDVEIAVPVAMMVQRADGIHLCVNFRDAKNSAKEIRLKFARTEGEK